MREGSGIRQIGSALASWGAVAAVTAAYVLWIGTSNHTIAALSYLLVVLVVSSLSTLWIAISASILAFLCFNFFFFPPVGTFRIDYAEDWITLFTLLAVSVVASQLSARARRQAQEAMAQRDELSRLLDERARLLRDREDAEVVRRSNELKSALLAALSHDLRTPLTAVTVAANNLKASWLSEEERREQTDIVLAELGRLNRLFQNLVDMARIEINAVAAEQEWVQPAEIVEAAVRQVEHALHEHRVELDVTVDKTLVRLDPRLTSAALARCSKTRHITRRRLLPLPCKLCCRRTKCRSQYAIMGWASRQRISITCSTGFTGARTTVGISLEPEWGSQSSAVCWRLRVDVSSRRTCRMADPRSPSRYPRRRGARRISRSNRCDTSGAHPPRR